MKVNENNFAFIDAASLHRGIKRLGWELDYKRFRVCESSFNKALVVSSDGDYASPVKFLVEKKKLETILSPATKKKCSILLKRTGATISYIDDQKNILMVQKEKAPDGDETS